MGAAGATTILGEWDFSSDERPYGDRLGKLASHTPSYTVYIDRAPKVAEVWPIVDDLTGELGIVTWLVVPGYRERSHDTVQGDLHLTRRAFPARPPAQRHPVPVTVTLAPVSDDAGWVARFAAQADAFARERGQPEPLVPVTLVDDDQFFLSSLEERPGEGFVTLEPHPEHYGEMVQGEAGVRRDA